MISGLAFDMGAETETVAGATAAAGGISTTGFVVCRNSS